MYRVITLYIHSIAARRPQTRLSGEYFDHQRMQEVHLALYSAVCCSPCISGFIGLCKYVPG